jgi:hypothetical protein
MTAVTAVRRIMSASDPRANATRPQLRLRLRTSYGEARIVVKQRIL